MNDPTRPTLPYASAAGDDPAVAHALRRTVGWAAIAYGGARSVGEVYYLALTRKWIGMGVDWGRFTAAQDAFEWSQAAAFAVLCVAGVLVLRRPAAGIVAVRVGAALALLTIFGARAYEAARDSMPFHYRALQAWSAVTYCILEVLLAAMTFGPLGRLLRRA